MSAPATDYEERLTLPWTWWPPALAIFAVLALQLGVTVQPVAAWLPAALLLPAGAAGLWWLGRLRVAVADHELRVDDARLPVHYIAEAVPLDAAGRQQLLGVAADPRAFVVQRPWVRGAVQVVLDDPADPTPYWLVSSRRPEQLASALTDAGRRAPARLPRASRAG